MTHQPSTGMKQADVFRTFLEEFGRAYAPAHAADTAEAEDWRPMDKVRVYYDRKGNSLSVWFDDPKKEHVCEETDDDVVLIKDRRGRVIGFERLNYQTAKQREDDMPILVEVQMV